MLRDRSGHWSTPNVNWNGDEFNRNANWLDNDWNGNDRVVLLATHNMFSACYFSGVFLFSVWRFQP